MKELILELVKNLPEGLQVLLLSAIPITELRAAIPIALYLGMSPVKAFGLSVLGNIAPVLPILLLLRPVVKMLEKVTLFNRIFAWLFSRTRKKSGDIEKYGLIGLTLFVGIPLPGTGAWTGALLAFLFGFPIGASFLAICLGVILAGGIVTLASMGVKQLLYFLNLEYLIIALVILALIWYRHKKKGK